jgi:hypothetical protein
MHTNKNQSNVNTITAITSTIMQWERMNDFSN